MVFFFNFILFFWLGFFFGDTSIEVFRLQLSLTERKQVFATVPEGGSACRFPRSPTKGLLFFSIKSAQVSCFSAHFFLIGIAPEEHGLCLGL